MKKTICVVTGSRADYGLLKWVMRLIKCDPLLSLQLVVTGAHLSPDYGLTISEIEEDGFSIDRKVEIILSSDTGVGIAKSMGLAVMGISDAFSDLRPDIILLLGDRYEIFSAASAALVLGIPVAHVHGGEVTWGAYDDSLRHAITKMSHLHFVSTEVYRKRVLQLGENPKYVFNIGALGVDSIGKLQLLCKKELEKLLDFKFFKRNLLITFHPVTTERNSKEQLLELLRALDEFPEVGLIFTGSNADNDSHMLKNIICDYVDKRVNARLFESLGQLRYFSCLRFVDGVVGNSSSGILEVPSFRKGTINIGMRQTGRVQAKSVINCESNYKSILAAINQLFSSEFVETLSTVTNPYGVGGASNKLVDVIKTQSLKDITKKMFCDT